MEREDVYLLTGLGNPGKKYEKTRHNLGFLVIEALARKYELNLKNMWRLQGKVASGMIVDKKVHLLMPTTYMNLSGIAIQKTLRFYHVMRKHMLVVVDDIYVQFASMRFRTEGSAGGHNGLKNIQACLGTQDYLRLRVGIGPQERKNFPDGRERLLEEYVLEDFLSTEQKALDQVIERAILVIEEWLKFGEIAASRLAGSLSQTGCE